MKKNGSKTFVRITNKDIFNEIKAIKELLQETIKCNDEDHLKMIGKMGRVQLMAGGAIAIAAAVATWFISYIMK
ncbi:MAG: hypothetical protein AB1467_06865 [Candidatus Diapherotrites archaeon]